MRVLLIVNPFASSVTPRGRERVHRELSARHEVTVVETTCRGHAVDLASAAIAEAYGAVVVFGGDGTVSEAGNGVAGSEVVLAPLPGGSTNVFARTIGVAKRLAKAAPQVAAVLAEGRTRAMAAGSVTAGADASRLFLFHVGMGFDAQVVAQVERHAVLKRRVGQSVFVYATFATWLRHFDRRHPHFAVRFPDGTSADDGYYAVCLNSNPYTYLGRRPLNLAPEADGQRGLAALTVSTVAIRTLFGLFGSAIGDGTRLRRNPKVDFHSDLSSLEVIGLRPFAYQVDGDYLGEASALSIRHDASRIRVIVP